jgi:hypothetical protein
MEGSRLVKELIKTMSILTVEKVGGFGGFGGNSHLRSRGQINIAKLSKEDKKAVDELFAAQGTVSTNTFRYKISRVTSKGIEIIEADESKIPAAVQQCVTDEII